MLSSEPKRKQYDATGRADRTVEEELMESFGGGKFRDKLRVAEEERHNLNESTGDDVTEEYGVNKSSYEAVLLPSIRAYQVRCNALGTPSETLEVITEAIPKELEWGEVLVNIRAMPINPGDVYNVKMGATPYSTEQDAPKLPFVAGNDGLGVVVKAGPGVKNLSENDWVLPYKASMGTWRALAAWREKDVLKIPADLLPMEYGAMLREMCVAYRLLEDHGQLKPGDSVILNAANSTVGTCVIQLCRMLKLRAIAVVRDPGDGDDYQKVVARLKALGASELLLDGDSIKAKLDENKYFAMPRLALDAVGGASAVALADALQDGCPLVIYGCLSGKAPLFPWAQWVFKDLTVRGFNLRKWQTTNRKKIPLMLETLSKLVNANKLRIDFTEYELCDEFKEAMDHAQEPGRNTKVLLRVNDVGVTY